MLHLTDDATDRFKRVGPNAMKGRGIGTARGRATIMRGKVFDLSIHIPIHTALFFFCTFIFVLFTITCHFSNFFHNLCIIAHDVILFAYYLLANGESLRPYLWQITHRLF